MNFPQHIWNQLKNKSADDLISALKREINGCWMRQGGLNKYINTLMGDEFQSIITQIKHTVPNY